MAKQKVVLVDTDILIKVFRGDEVKEKILRKIGDGIAISSITAIELSTGVQSKRGMVALKEQLTAYKIYEVSSEISQRARLLALRYNISYNLFAADALIAATALELNLPLMTDNNRDFDFIEGLVFY